MPTARAQALNPSGLRVLLVADLLARIAELGGLQAFVAHATEDEDAETATTMPPEARALGILPPAVHAACRDATRLLGGPVDIHLVGQGAPPSAGPGGHQVIVGPAHGPGLRADLAREPLAVRLALISVPYYEPADLSAQVLADATSTLGTWRQAVAVWAESPSAPVPRPTAEPMREAFSRLDTATVLRLLPEVADRPDLPPGAAFETFVSADRVLGLELMRDVGTPHG